jgi:IS5 family transposase
MQRGAVEPVIGHTKNEHRMDQNYLAHRSGDANNAILAAPGDNFSLLIKWLRFFYCVSSRHCSAQRPNWRQPNGVSS